MKGFFIGLALGTSVGVFFGVLLVCLTVVRCP